MTFGNKPAARRTLPAPSGPVNVEDLLLELEHLKAERAQLVAQLDAREAAAREAVALTEEVARLRTELARVRSGPAPRPFGHLDEIRDLPAVPRASPVPRDMASSALFAPGDVPSGGAWQAPPMPTQGIDFGAVSRLSPAELDQLPYGLICLDAQGRVVHYNDTESRLAKLPKERVIGRSFFGEVAPCTRVREFEGEFLELVRDPSRVRVRSFDFVFRFRHSEQHVTIVMTPARQRGLYNLALLRRSVTPT
ncbi:MAG: PAS domain-containing protein [Polyangiaceae bacterium]|nr:PAS domain-containing protein [Polyangiaceae bacterium]